MRKFPDLNMIVENFWENIKDLKSDGELIFFDKPRFDIYAFPQTWGSTALGFGGYGGQSITKAMTTVIIDNGGYIAGVYFDNELAYIIEDPNHEFVDDLDNRCMAPVWKSGKYKE